MGRSGNTSITARFLEVHLINLLAVILLKCFNETLALAETSKGVTWLK